MPRGNCSVKDLYEEYKIVYVTASDSDSDSDSDSFGCGFHPVVDTLEHCEAHDSDNLFSTGAVTCTSSATRCCQSRRTQPLSRVPRLACTRPSNTCASCMRCVATAGRPQRLSFRHARRACPNPIPSTVARALLLAPYYLLLTTYCLDYLPLTTYYLLLLLAPSPLGTTRLDAMAYL